MTTLTENPALSRRKNPEPPRQSGRRRTGAAAALLHGRGEPWVWLMGGAMVVCLGMVLGLGILVTVQGVWTFWPGAVIRLETQAGRTVMGELTRKESYRVDQHESETSQTAAKPSRRQGDHPGQWSRRRLIRIGNFELTGEHFVWVSDAEVVPGSETRPEWALVVERLAWGRFYGEPVAFEIDGKTAAEGPEATWRMYLMYQPVVQRLRKERLYLEKHELGQINYEREQARLALRKAELKFGRHSPAWEKEHQAFRATEQRQQEQLAEVQKRIEQLNRESLRYQMRLRTGDGQEKSLALAEVVRAYPANRLSVWGRMGVYLSRWWEFLTEEPREANSEGGVFPAIFGTAVMTVLMSVMVVPLGVLAALYLREYARAGIAISAVRIAINNLAGVPSIVFGVFGLGFFCYTIGGSLDQMFFPERLPSPTFGTGGLLWASLTLALLTLPVVIVATEEAIAAVPRSMREGSYACGASQWQTIRRIVLPRAMPGIMTGMILAMARGAGEVAPLMLVGAVKLAPELPVDGRFPYIHLERSFMHLGFHIYDVGFQSQNSEAAKPMVFTTTLLLVALVMLLNLTAMWLRARLRRRYAADRF